MAEDTEAKPDYVEQLEAFNIQLTDSNDELAQKLQEIEGKYVITPHKVILVLEKVYKIPEDTKTQLVAGGLTDRQATAIIMHSEGKKIEDIALEITEGKSKYTQNAHDALNGAVTKILHAITLMRALCNNKPVLQSALDRELAVGSKFVLEPYEHLFE